MTPTKVELARQLATRQSRLSAETSETSRTKAIQGCAACGLPAAAGPADKVSTRNFTPYCVLTEHATAPSTATRITVWAIGLRRR